MKKILLLTSAFLLTMNASFASCLCDAPTFTNEDEAAAVAKFVSSKLGSNEVVKMTLTKKLAFARYDPFKDPTRYSPNRDRFGGLGGYDGLGMTRCEVECANIENTVNKYDVEFKDGASSCTVNLKVTMMSRGSGFKSSVKQKYAPVCQ